MVYSTFCNTQVDHITVSAFTTLPPVHKSIFIPAWMEICPCCFMLLYDTLLILADVGAEGNLLSDTPPITRRSASQPAVHLSIPTEHIWNSGTSSSFLPKGKSLQVNSSLDKLFNNNTHCVKHRVFCSGEL